MPHEEPSKPLDTDFASGERASDEELRSEIRLCVENPIIALLLETVESHALVLNEHRQILAVNASARKDLDLEGPELFQGLRPGELLHCAHAFEGPHGCGTGSSCRHCGAVLSILAAQENHVVAEGECTLEVRQDDAQAFKDFRVRVVPFVFSGRELLLVVLSDVSDLRQKEKLDRLFLHDLMNTLQGLHGWTELLQTPTGSDVAVAAQRILDLSDHLTREVFNQHLLVRAEQGDLKVEWGMVEVASVLMEVRQGLQHHPSMHHRTLTVQPCPTQLRVECDARILHRILFNMAVNALEAVREGGEVSIWVESDSQGIGFVVHNDGMIPESVAEQIFHYAFSTKAHNGRGLGTYGMKLLGEKVLGGQVGFTSSEEAGTHFYLRLPLQRKSA